MAARNVRPSFFATMRRGISPLSSSDHRQCTARVIVTSALCFSGFNAEFPLAPDLHGNSSA